MWNGTKVYFTPLINLYDDTSMPILYGALKIIREICYIKKVDIIHTHQNASILFLEGIFLPKMLWINTIFTDYSLCGFIILDEVRINKILRVFCRCRWVNKCFKYCYKKFNIKRLN